ncbi:MULTISPECIES: ATP synthase subunit I [Moraxella]|uniref:ATP synthase protein n=1 Tax=Moraxella catarrhalis TaxID=480 RepID=A0A7Z0UYI2_MORCA|nr:ATP synthase subunit I [Moraxella catarrhalis]OAV00821.1 ATP synthase protein [Moraxella catarrhalis]STY81243.1 F0F1 ATP synthase subunit I [Moraxella catarrhalis]
MSRPAQRNKKSAIYKAQMRQIWAVLGVMIFGLVLSYVMADADRLIAKGLSIGALIAFIGQLIFTHIAYHTVGAKYARQIMLNTYLGLVIKWATTLALFAFVFLKIQPISTVSVIIGYIILIISQNLVLIKIK